MAALLKISSDDIPLLQSRGDRPLHNDRFFEPATQILNPLFHLEEYDSAAAPCFRLWSRTSLPANSSPRPKALAGVSYGEALNTRGLNSCSWSTRNSGSGHRYLPEAHSHLGNLVAIDGTLIDAVCSMTWADYSSTNQKGQKSIWALKSTAVSPEKFV